MVNEERKKPFDLAKFAINSLKQGGISKAALYKHQEELFHEVQSKLNEESLPKFRIGTMPLKEV